MSRPKTVTIDLSNTCTLECEKCRRQEYRSVNHPPGGLRGKNMSLDDFDKVIEYFNNISVCGQVSDPIFNPWFHEMAARAYKKGKHFHVATAATSKKHDEEWYRKAFEAHPDAKWTFGIDGLPEESCMYRINQDGEFLFEMAKLCAKMCKISEWQYIVFSYNEDHIEEAYKMAKENGIVFMLNISGRWNVGRPDMFKPKNEIFFKKRPEEWETLAKLSRIQEKKCQKIGN